MIRELKQSNIIANLLIRYRLLLQFSIIIDTIIFGLPLPDSEFVDLVEKNLVRKDDCVLEIGSNKGGLTKSLLKAVGNCGRVYACEPNPIAYEYSRLILGRKSNLISFNIGLGRKNSEGHLERRWLTDETAKLAEESLHVPERISFKCRILTMDYLAKHLNPKPNVVLIDAEGAELDVLEGGIELLSSARDLRLAIELHPTERPTIVEDVLQKMREFGYEAKLIDKSKETVTYFFARIQFWN